MKVAKQAFLTIPVFLFVIGMVQPVAAQEWKNLSSNNSYGPASVQSLLNLPSWVKREVSGQNKVELPKVPPQHFAGKDMLRLNNEQSREYAREGSWAPLETKPGEESFHLFTF